MRKSGAPKSGGRGPKSKRSGKSVSKKPEKPSINDDDYSSKISQGKTKQYSQKSDQQSGYSQGKKISIQSDQRVVIEEDQEDEAAQVIEPKTKKKAQHIQKIEPSQSDVQRSNNDQEVHQTFANKPAEKVQEQAKQKLIVLEPKTENPLPSTYVQKKIEINPDYAQAVENPPEINIEKGKTVEQDRTIENVNQKMEFIEQSKEIKSQKSQDLRKPKKSMANENDITEYNSSNIRKGSINNDFSMNGISKSSQNQGTPINQKQITTKPLQKPPKIFKTVPKAPEKPVAQVKPQNSKNKPSMEIVPNFPAPLQPYTPQIDSDLQYSEEAEESDEMRVKYDSRINQQYDDPESMYEPSDDEEEEGHSHDTSQKSKLTKMDRLKNEELKQKKDLENTKQLIDAEKQKQAMGANSDQDIKPNKRFKNFNDVFSGLTKSKNVVTKFPIVDCIITYNSKSAITVTKQGDREYHITAYSLETYGITFEEQIGGRHTESYIKLKEVEQNSSGTNFACVFLDDGVFKLRVLGDTTRTQEEIEKTELNINKRIYIGYEGELTEKEKTNGMNNFTMPINNFPDPYITCCFCTNDVIFVNLFHNATVTHHQFFYNWKTDSLFRLTRIKMDSNEKNFPYKCFFSEDNNEIYSFYRQGESFIIPYDPQNQRDNGLEDPLERTLLSGQQLGSTQLALQAQARKPEFIFEKIYDKDLGQMYLINGTALIARSSNKILFFKLKRDEFTGERSWHNYHTIQNRGFIYFIKGNKRIQITSDQYIQFYLIDPITFMPTLENVMYNFMNCSQMMFGSKVKYGITFKTNSSSFDIYRRKYEHNYQVNAVSKYNLDGSRGLPIETMSAFLISKIDKIMFFDIKEFKEIKECQINIPLLKSEEEREPNQIISMQVSQNEDFLAVISGKNLIMNEQKPNQLFIFKRIKDYNTDAMDKFELHTRIVIKDKVQQYPEFKKLSMQFTFQLTKHGRDPHTIIFATQNKLFTLNFETEAVEDLVVFDEPLSRQPEFFLMNDEQTVSIIASMEDGIYYNHRTKKQIDLDEEFQISAIKEIIYDHEDRVFYLLANKHHSKLGLFLIKFSEKNPCNNNHKFFLKYKNKLDISDADIAVLRNPEKNFKELIISYKTIFINTYTVRVIDISTEDPWPMYSHESFQLWESQVTGFFLQKTQDFVTINREGINVLTLESRDKKAILHENGQEKMIHSLESANYLKIDKKNLIQFQFSSDEKIISIVQQYWKKNSKQGNETEYENIYNIRIHEITLRELLLFQSLYVCNTLSDILKLVQNQPLPEVFFKSFLELDGSNMTSILSFDSRSLHHLLKSDNSKFFSSDFPMFYKNKIVKSNNKEKYFYRSAIDMALRNNQVSAVTTITNYIVTYQNNYVSSFLFLNNFQNMIQKGIKIRELFDSNVFCHKFDFDEWPSTHVDASSYQRPYNQSIFEIRESYRDIFQEAHFQAIDDESNEFDSSKIYKVSYTLNTLAQLGEYVHRDQITGEKSFVNKDDSLMQMCIDAEDELEIFDSENFQQLIKFKWDEYTRSIHLVGCMMHFLYVFLLILYVNAIYIQNSSESKRTYETLLIFGIIYPMCYDLKQLLKAGVTEYFSDGQNYADQLYIWCSVVNVISQNISEFDAFHNKILMTILLIMQITKTFFYLRIFESLSYIVTMIYQVVSDLKVFGLFFGILIILFSMVFAVIGVGNTNIKGDLKDFAEAIEAGEEDEPENFPFEEYSSIGLLAGNIITTLRIALGDFDFDPSQYVTLEENWLYWIVWLMVVTMTCIIFLNFIIAEASNSYQTVKDNLTALVMKERASLIAEAENQIPESYKDDYLFPKYIVVRKVET